jgi:hypothetical protein
LIGAASPPGRQIYDCQRLPAAAFGISSSGATWFGFFDLTPGNGAAQALIDKYPQWWTCVT